MPTASEFRALHPDVCLFLATNPDLDAAVRYESEGGVLPDNDVERLTGWFASEVEMAPESPAQAWNAINVPNGDFTVENSTVRFDFRIHLVQEGQLAGQRVLKIRGANARIYSGFATITRSGGMKLWRRFERDSGERYVFAAEVLLERLRQLNSGVPPHISSSQHLEGELHTEGEWTIRFAHRCSLCNEPALLGNDTPAPLCAVHIALPAPVLVPTTLTVVPGPDPELEALLAEEEAIEREMRPTATAPRRPRRSRRPEGVPAGVLLCQNGTGEVR